MNMTAPTTARAAIIKSPSDVRTIIKSPSDVRKINRAHVLRAIQLEGPVTRPEVVRLTGLSKATVRDVCDALIFEGLLEEQALEAAQQRGPGRPPAVLRYRGAHGHVLGIDVGSDKILVLLSDLAGAVIARHRIALPPDPPPARDFVLAHIERAVTETVSAAHIDRRSLLAVVAGTPGVVDPDTGVLNLAPQIAGWGGTRPAEEIGRRLGCPVHVENEVQLAVLGERWRGAAHALDAAVYLQLGIGVAAGIVVGGELLRGAAGGAGEIGYLPVPGAPAPPDGFGAFEWSAGGRAFARQGQAAARGRRGARLLELAGGKIETIDAQTVFAAARDGDPTAQAIVGDMAELIAHGISALACVLNPAVVVIGGGLSNAGPSLLDPLNHAVRRMVPLPPELVLSQLGEQAVAFGALRMALDTAHTQLEVPIAI
jgi:glucokinase